MPSPSHFQDAPRPLVLDLSGVDRLSASGVRELLALRGRLEAMGGMLVLSNVNGAAAEALRRSGLALPPTSSAGGSASGGRAGR